MKKRINESALGGVIVGFIVGVVFNAISKSGNAKDNLNKLEDDLIDRDPSKEEKIKTGIEIAKDILKEIPEGASAQDVEAIVRKHIQDVDDEAIKGISTSVSVNKDKESEKRKLIAKAVEKWDEDATDPKTLETRSFNDDIRSRMDRYHSSVEETAKREYLAKVAYKIYKLFYDSKGVYGFAEKKNLSNIIQLIGSDPYINDDNPIHGSLSNNWRINVEPLGDGSFKVKYILRLFESHNFERPVIEYEDTFSLNKENSKEFKEWVKKTSSKSRSTLLDEYPRKSPASSSKYSIEKYKKDSDVRKLSKKYNPDDLGLD